jgi:hypothetical protein
MLPQNITERAVALYRDLNPDRMIVHYIQPHRPHIATAYEENRLLTDAERDPSTHLKHGGDRSQVFSNHVADLEFVLQKGVEPLLRDIDLTPLQVDI